MVDEKLMNFNEMKPHSAPAASTAFDTKLQRDKPIYRKSLLRRSIKIHKNKKILTEMPSSASLHSLVSILKPTCSDQNQQRSEPNVSFKNKNDYRKNEESIKNYDDDDDDDDDDVNENIHAVSKSSINANTITPSIDNSTSQLNYTIECDEFSTKAIPNGSLSTQMSTIGFRASFFSVLEKLGVWRSQDLYKPTSSQNPSEIRFTTTTSKSNNNNNNAEHHTTGRSSITSLYFRKLHGGKVLFYDFTCCLITKSHIVLIKHIFIQSFHYVLKSSSR
jgi:hypothetical protein